LEAQLNDKDILVRFVYDSKNVRSDGTIKHQEFMPRGERNNLSVFHKYTSDESEIWALSDTIRPDSRKGFARGEITVGLVQETGLTVDFDNIPPNHANIEGWPTSSEKDKQKSLAQELAAKAVAVKR
jgi:hypothetical protein